MKIHELNRKNNSAEKAIQLYEQLVTVGDLYEFRNQLLKDIKHLFSSTNPIPTKQWLQYGEVKNLLNIPLGTLQTIFRVILEFYFNPDIIFIFLLFLWQFISTIFIG